MGEPMPLASHAVAAPADAAVSPTVWLLPGITVPAARKNGRREGARVASVV